MKKQMDIIALIRRLRAHGFALSMMFEKKTLTMISKKSKGKPFESEEEIVVKVESDLNMWGDKDMFTKQENTDIAKRELKEAIARRMSKPK